MFYTRLSGVCVMHDLLVHLSGESGDVTDDEICKETCFEKINIVLFINYNWHGCYQILIFLSMLEVLCWNPSTSFLVSSH